jgi:hypothetical protein
LPWRCTGETPHRTSRKEARKENEVKRTARSGRRKSYQEDKEDNQCEKDHSYLSSTLGENYISIIYELEPVSDRGVFGNKKV